MVKYIGYYIFIGFFTIFGIFIITIGIHALSTYESGLGRIVGLSGLLFGISFLISAILGIIQVIWMKKRSKSLDPDG